LFVFFGAVLHVFSIQRQPDYINSNSTRATCLLFRPDPQWRHGHLASTATPRGRAINYTGYYVCWKAPAVSHCYVFCVRVSVTCPNSMSHNYAGLLGLGFVQKSHSKISEYSNSGELQLKNILINITNQIYDPKVLYLAISCDLH